MPVSATTNCAENETRNDRIRANEAVLISRIQEGEKDLFLELIRPYQRTVYAILISMLGSKEDAEDVTQDVLLKALARLRQFRLESAFGTWLIQIAINEARMRKRKLRHGIIFSLTKGVDDEGVYVSKDFADWGEIPSEALERSEIRNALAKALTLLEEHYRLAFISPRCERTEHHGNCQHLGNYTRSRKNAPSTRSFDVEGYSVPRAATGWRGGVSIQRGKETIGMT